MCHNLLHLSVKLTDNAFRDGNWRKYAPPLNGFNPGIVSATVGRLGASAIRFALGPVHNHVIPAHSGLSGGRPDAKDATNDQWERIECLLPGKAADPGATAKDNRPFWKRCCGLHAPARRGEICRRNWVTGTTRIRASCARARLNLVCAYVWLA